MDNINKVKRQKAKGKSIILLLAIYGVLLANPVNLSNHGLKDGSVTMPEITVTAQRPTTDIITMPDIVVTAKRPTPPTEITMATDKPAVYIKQTQNSPTLNRLISLKELKHIAVEIKNSKNLSEPEIVKAAVKVKVERYTKRQGKLIIEKADTVKEDIKFSGGTAIIDGVLDGDFSVMGGNVELNGLVDGDVALFGGSMNIAGKIKGDAAIMGGNVVNKGTVDGDLLVAGGSIKLDSGSVVTGDIAIIGGTIAKDTNATVKGNIKSVSSKLFNKAFPKFPGLMRWTEGLPGMLTQSAKALVALIVLGGFFVLALLVMLIFPKPVETIALKTQNNIWVPIAIGFGLQLLFVPLIILLGVSIVGIPIIPLFVLAVFACLMLGLTSVYYLIGTRIRPATDQPKQGMIAKFALGFIVIMALPILGVLIRIISPIGGLFSVLGFVVIYVVATIGLGAAFYTLVTRKKQ